MRKNYLLIAALLLSISVSAQQYHRCSAMEVKAAEEQANPGLKTIRENIERDVQKWISSGNKTTAVITIPVVVHVLYNTSAQNISDAKVQAQINQLNLDFARMNSDASNTPSAFTGAAANTQIQFCLAQRDPNGGPTNGIIHKQTTVTSFSSNDYVKYNANGGDNAWPSSGYLNIWSCNLGGGLLGYAQFPGGAAATDGVVLLYSSIGSMLSPGTATPYHLGRTATHEVGHWLGLYHIWGDDGTACTGTDQITDTPNQAGNNFGCPSFPKVSCGNGPNGDMFMNYMDYTDDGCMNLFTTGQTSRITATMNGARASLQTSLGCTPPSTACGTPSGLVSSLITTTGATLSWIATSNATSYNVQYRVSGTTNWTTITSTTNSKALTGLVSSTLYQYQIQAVCSSGNSTYSAIASFTTATANCTDIYEQNNTRNTSKVVATNTYINALVTPIYDNDYFKVTTVSGATNLKVTLDQLPLDYDVKLYNQSGTQLAVSQNAGATAETIIRNSTTAGIYYIRVYGHSGANSATACYRLIANVSGSVFRESGISEQPEHSAKEGSLEPVEGIDGLTLFPNPANETITLSYFTTSSAIASVEIIDMIGKTVFNTNIHSEEGFNKSELSLESLKSGIYFVKMNDSGSSVVKKFIVKK